MKTKTLFTFWALLMMLSQNVEAQNLFSSGHGTISGNNVGIRTSQPLEALQIGDRWTFHDGGVKYIGYNMQYDGTRNVRMVQGGAGRLYFDPAGFGFKGQSVSKPAGTAISEKYLLWIDFDGTVKIGDVNATQPWGPWGKPTSDYLLYVSKGIRTEQVRVDLENAWPDYVFEEDYVLATLEEVEAFLSEKGHLPGIPSASEVQAEGINLGEMDALLLEKIEEITLHLIQLQRQNAALKSQVEKLVRDQSQTK